MNFKKLALNVSFLLMVANGYSQNPVRDNFQQAMPVSPEVAAFAKNVDIPMSYGSGTPQIGIPFYTLKSGGIQVPISIGYNASGIRVDEVATWTGLGWNLSTGPSLVRVVRGLPDEEGYGFMNTPSNRKIHYIDSVCIYYWTHTPNEFNANSAYMLDIEGEVKAGSLDIEPDLYNFSALGYSGQFFWNQDSAKYIMMPYQNIKLEGGATTGWTITLPNGIKCYFGDDASARENFRSSTNTQVIEGFEQSPTTTGYDYTNSWLITKIQEPSGRYIQYNYALEANWSKDFSRGGEIYNAASTRKYAPNNWIMNFGVQQFSKPVLQSISADNCDIYFYRHSTLREDVYPGTAGKSLDTITITTKHGVEIKSFLFNYEYTTSRDSISLWGLEAYTNVARKRLWLKSIQEKNITHDVSVPPYEFTYSNTQLPNRLSSSQDYWGYYNGKLNSYSLMSRHLFHNTQGADRRINTDSAQAGILKKIKYPTGGTTTYYYESNNAITNMYLADPFDVNEDMWGFPEGLERPDAIDKSFTFMPLVPETGPYDGIYSATFSIGIPASKIKVTPNLPAPCGVNSSMDCNYTFYIKSLPDSAITYMINTTGTAGFDLPIGDYKIVLVYNDADTLPFCSVDIEWLEAPDSLNFKIGGLRVKKIVSSDSAGNTISRSFEYKWPGANYSSGLPAGIPTHVIHEADMGRETMTSIDPNIYWMSNSGVPLTQDGQTVRYMFVTEYYDTARTSFKTEYAFIQDMPSINFGPRTNQPAVTQNWLNNVPLFVKKYEKTNTGYRILSEDWTYYTSFLENGGLIGLHDANFIPYYYETERYVLTANASTTYAYDGSDTLTLQTNTYHEYNDQFNLSKSITTNSKGDSIHNKVWYPDDYNNVSGYNLSDLKTKYMIGLPIKQESSINGKIKSGAIIKYNAYGYPINVYSYEKSTLEDTVSHDRNTVLETDYQLKATASYDINHNIKQVETFSEPKATLIYGNEYLINTDPVYYQVMASVQNADSSSVACTSFEIGTKGNWNYSGSISVDTTCPTGNHRYSLTTTDSIYRSGLNSSKTYIVSYWSKNGSYTVTGSTATKTGKTIDGWTYYEHQVTGTTYCKVSGTGYIDELRLYPKGALMISYTYQQPIGISSQCDPNNRITYYEYDGLGRLLRVRDQDKNIIKRYCYNYQGQVTACSDSLSLAAPPDPCATCTGNDKKCIDGVCETGFKCFTGSTRTGSSTWNCYYIYIWSDGSWSETYTEVHDGPCGSTCP